MWSRIPLVRLIIPYIAGILLSAVYSPAIPAYLLYWLGLAVLSGGLLFGILFSYRTRWVYGSFIIIFLLVTGFFFAERREGDEKNMLSAISADSYLYVGVIEEAFELRERSCRGLLKLVSVKDSTGFHPIGARLMVYTEPDSTLAEVRAGNIIIIYAAIRPLNPPANPAEFDYKTYLARKGIYHSTYLKAGQWHITDKDGGFNLMHFAAGLRGQLLRKLNENGISDRQFSVSAALLLGDDSYLGDEIREVYSRAGAMHILCVSGLHVGVIFLVLMAVFGFLKHFRFGKILIPVLMILSIWMYALITGLAPPVMRASCMISFIIIGNALNRQKNVYNTLAAAALLMLLLEPYTLFGAGFQLSYAAVLGIVFIQRPLYNTFYFKYSFPDKIWAITTVSIAAQLGTLPVVIYYFHQFPVYSLLTNLIVIPLSSFIIYAGFMLFFMPSLSYAATAAAWALGSLIQLMDKGVSAVDDLPNSAIGGISIDWVMVIFLYLIIIAICFYLISKHKASLFLGLSLVLVFSCYRLFIYYEHEKQREFIVYAVNGHSAYDIIERRNHTFMADSALLASEGKINYSIRPNWMDKGLEGPEILLLPGTDSDYTEKGKCEMLPVQWCTVVLWQGKLPACLPPENKLKPDILILRGKCPFDIEDLYKWFDPQIIILDSSVPWWKIEAMKAQQADRSLWIVRMEGAFMSS